MVHGENLVDAMDESSSSPAVVGTTKRPVVVFPSRGRMSVREAVSTRNSNHLPVTAVSSKSKPRPRSMSAGRSRPADLVQDIYDRMGLSMKRGDPVGVRPDLQAYEEQRQQQQHPADRRRLSGDRTRTESVSSSRGGASGVVVKPSAAVAGPPDQFLEDRYRAAADISRGRSDEPGSNKPEERRSRSLSRGRKLSRPWPPPGGAGGGGGTAEESVSSPAPGSPMGWMAASKRANGNIAVRTSIMSAGSPRAASFGSSYHSRKDSWKDEKKEEDDSYAALSVEELNDELLQVTPPSVKDRASVYGGANKPKTRNLTRKYDPQYAAQFAVREKPPKVNIYGGKLESPRESNVILEEKMEGDLVGGTARSTTPKNADTATEQARKGIKNCEIASFTSSRSTKSAGNVASSFLTTIHTPKELVTPKHETVVVAPMIEISASSDHGEAMSSVTAEEFGPGSFRFGREAKKPTWQERNRVRAYSGGAEATNTTAAKSSNMSAEAIERMVDERVQAQFQSLESRMEANMRQWMNQMDDKIMNRLDGMEEQMNGLKSVLKSIQSPRRNGI